MSKEEKKFSWVTILLIGFGFFTTGISWSVVNSLAPIWLNLVINNWLPGFLFVSLLAGFVMGIDNLIAIIMNPLMGSRSDRTWNRWGRRMPYIIVGIPLAVAFLIGMPIAATFPGVTGFAGLVILILGFDVAMAIYRAPVVAMMPDFTPPQKRSPANGVINLMGGIGSIIAFVIGLLLFDVNQLLAFGVVAIIMISCLVLLILTIREPMIPQEVEKVDSPLWQGLKEAFSDRSILSILFAIFAWFVTFNTLETWFTSYGVFTLTMSPGLATFTMTLFALVFVVFAIPGGLIALKLGRRNTIMIGLVGFIITLFGAMFITDQFLLMGLLGLGGFFWAFVNVNSIVILWEVSRKKQGTFTGIYYVFSQLAAAIGPIIFGGIVDLLVIFSLATPTSKWSFIWPYSIFFLVLALIAMFFVKRGEAGEEDQMSTEQA
jgi:MFS family permease